MSKKYLFSGGDLFTEEQIKVLRQDLKGKSNLVSIGAKREYEKNDKYFYGTIDTNSVEKQFSFSDLNQFSLIDGRTPRKEGLELLEKADIIYLQGGDPFAQLDYIRNNNYDKFLKDYKGIIIGFSAGSMNLSKISFYSKDEDYPETCFYEGLGLVNITIDPHFDITDNSRINELKECSLKKEIIGLPDNSLIIVDENDNIIEYGANYKYSNGALRDK
ncbi:MAG: Type 1 glutamine amidotransferase-like domain-containing protein [Bacilli bacterium]|nr:Type 1 glutamine amidotransferase-like domain-containing protein [Bacilli bacterium]